jgi:hypothetical protein
MSITVLILLQLADAALTLAHSIEELKGRLADYFGAIVGVRIPAWIGVVFFFAVLTAMLWLVAAIGIAGSSIWPNCFTIAMLALLVGCRVSDGLFSHLLLHAKGFRQNPGLKTTPLYFIEAVLLCLIFRNRLFNYPVSAIVGFLFGAAAFYLILPVLRHFGPSLWPVRDQWRPGTPRPD